ncbi:MAG: molybdopterin-dependent oxidoreductase [Anaerolineae bacterium]
MLKNTLILLGLSAMLLAALVGCGGPSGGGEPASGEVALKITGNVANEMAWTENEVRSMDTIEAERENKEGEMSTYTGVPIKALLEEAGVSDEATAVAFVAEHDYTADSGLGEVMACDDCIVSFRNQGGFSIVMPGYSGKLQVKGVVEIRVE